MEAICADTVLCNARMHEPDGSVSKATAIASRNGRIVYLGDDEGARSLVFEHETGTARTGTGGDIPGSKGPLDMKGALILPGLTDAHLHFADTALGLSQVNGETPDVSGALDRVAGKARSLEPGEWILGYGWNHNVWGGRYPGAADLDRVAPRNPVMLMAKSCHAIWVNHAALSLAGITREIGRASCRERV